MDEDKTFPVAWMSAPDEHDTAFAARRAAPETFARVYRAHATTVYRYVARVYGPERANDAVQDAWLRFYQCLLNGEEIDKPQAWLVRAARNALINRAKVERAALTDAADALTEVAANTPTPERAAVQRDQLHRAFQQLTPEQQEVLLARGRGLSYREIAEALGEDLGPVAGRLRRAMDTLARILQWPH